MKTKFCDTDFLYMSARIRELENKLIGRSSLEKLIECKGYNEALEVAASMYGCDGDDLSADSMLLHETEKTYSEVENMTRISFDKSLDVVIPFRYVYDCHNLKVLIKAEALNMNASHMLVPLGTVSIEKAATAVRDRDFGVFPKYLGKAANAAREKILTSRDPHLASIILDKAVFLDIFDKCEEVALPLLTELFGMKADFANIGIFLRTTNAKASADTLASALVSGGFLSESFFVEAFAGGRARLFEALENTRYSEISRAAADNGLSLSELELLFDGFCMREMQRAKLVPFGAQVSVGYLLAKENEIKNVRLVLACKEADVPADEIKKRLRASF